MFYWNLLFIFLAISGCNKIAPDHKSKENSRLGSPDSVDEKVLDNAKVNIPVTLLSQLSALCVTMDKDTKELVQRPCKSGDQQQFRIQQVTENSFLLLTPDNKCLRIKASDSKETSYPGAKIEGAICDTSDTRQLFTFLPGHEDYLYLKILSLHSNKCLDILEKKQQINAPLHQWDCEESPSQGFMVDIVPKTPKKIPKKVWTFWDKGADNMNPFYKANVEVWKKRLGQDFEIVVLSNKPEDPGYIGKHIRDYRDIPTVDDLKAKIMEKPPIGDRLNPFVVFSDLVRIQVMYEQGGIWIDPSIILHDDLSRFIDVIENLSSFSIGGYTSRHQATRELRYTQSLENFFFLTYPKNPLVKEWRDNFYLYWDLKTNAYSILNHPMYDGTNGFFLDTRKLYKDLANYLNQHAALAYTVTKNPQFIDQIFIRSNVNNPDKGAFTMLQLVNFDDKKYFDLSEQDISHFVKELKYVSMSKFPSKDMRNIGNVDHVEYFFDTKNIFGTLNSLPNPDSEWYALRPILSCELDGQTVDEVADKTVNKVVWAFWDKGQASLPAFNQYNVNHWRKILEPLGYQIRILNLIEGDKDNAISVLGGKDLLPKNWDTLDQVIIPYFGPDKGEVKMVPAVVKSDFIRLAVLEKFGGIWMDTSNVLLRDLDNIAVSELNSSLKTVAGYIMSGYASKGSPVVNDEPVDGTENWLIIAKKGSRLIKAWRTAFVHYWETRKAGQWISHHEMYRNFDFGGMGLSAPNYLNQHAALKYVLHYCKDLGQQIYPIKNLQPWWLHDKVGGHSHNLYEGFIAKDIDVWAAEIKTAHIGLLKFAGGHLHEIREKFPTIDTYCTTKNLITLLYGHCP